MARLSALSTLIALTLLAGPTLAQETGGVPLTPEVLNTADAQQQAVNLALSLLQQMQVMQQLQQPRGTAVGSGAPAMPAPGDPNAVNPAAGRSSVNQQAIARFRGDPGYLAGFSGGQPLAASRARPPSRAADPSQTLVVNAVDSPVSIGNGNIVHQQVANSTAIGRGATASSGAASHGHGRGALRRDGSVSQEASSLAVSQGGEADATASNSSTFQR